MRPKHILNGNECDHIIQRILVSVLSNIFTFYDEIMFTAYQHFLKFLTHNGKRQRDPFITYLNGYSLSL